MTAVSLPIYQQTEEWLDARLEGIGSSEAAAAIGMSRWEANSRIWALKLKLIEGRIPTIAMLVGTATEDLNARLYAEATGRPVRRVRRLQRSRQFPWMLASLDRRSGDRIVECKWTERATDYGEPGTDEVPDEVLVQVLHQMIVTDLPAADVSVIVGGREHRIYHVELDALAAEEIVEREAAFWRSVQERTEPAIDGTESSREYLAARYPRSNGFMVEADEAVRRDLAALRALKRNEKQVGTALDEVTNRLRQAIGENAGIVAPGLGSLTWHRWEGVETTSDVTDWQAVAAAFRGLLLGEDPYTADTLDALVGIHTNPVTTVTKKAGQKLGPAVWEEEEAIDDVA